MFSERELHKQAQQSGSSGPAKDAGSVPGPLAGLAAGTVESGKRSRWELRRALVILVTHQTVVGAVDHTVLEKDHPKTCLVRR